MEDRTEIIRKWLGTGSLNIFGLPFAGKDTQGEILAKLFNGVMISGGDIMRHSKDNKKVQAAMAGGGIVPSELFEEIVMPHLADPKISSRPLILSEVGRMEGEQQVIMKVATSSDHPIKAVILLKLPEEEVFNRFEAAKQLHDRGERADDKREVLKARLDSYHEKVMPVLEWYRDKALLIEVDGTQSRGDVTESMLESLLKLADNSKTAR